MNKRLMRSRSEVVIAGVCGGLADYFNVDPVIVRLVFVLLGFASWGMAFMLYPILWWIMPQAPQPPESGWPQLTEDQSVVIPNREQAHVGGRVAGNQPYLYNPQTGERLPHTGDTGRLPSAEAEPSTPSPRRSSSIFGIILIGLGLMGIASIVGIPASVVLPILLIGLGILLVRR